MLLISPSELINDEDDEVLVGESHVKRSVGISVSASSANAAEITSEEAELSKEMTRLFDCIFS